MYPTVGFRHTVWVTRVPNVLQLYSTQVILNYCHSNPNQPTAVSSAVQEVWIQQGLCMTGLSHHRRRLGFMNFSEMSVPINTRGRGRDMYPFPLIYSNYMEQNWLSRYSNGLPAGWPRFDFRQVQMIFLVLHSGQTGS